MNDTDAMLRNPIVWIAAIAGIGVLSALLHAVSRRTGPDERKSKPEPDEESPPSVRRFRPSRPWQHFDQRFENMVYRSRLGMQGVDAMGLVSLTTVAGAAIGYFLFDELWITLLGALIGLIIPLVTIRVLSGRYRRQLQHQLPDFFYMLARFLRGGLTLPQALEQAETEDLQPIATELSQINSSIDLGLSVRRSLESAARRIQLTDFDAFVSVVGLTQTTGGDLSIVLDRLAAGSRDREQFRRQFVAATQSGRITAVLLALAAPILVLIFYLMDPERFASFVQSGFGMTLLAVAVVLQVIGLIWILRILRIDY